MNKQIERLKGFKRLKENNTHHNSTLNQNREHPLLNGLVLENTFGYLKGQSNAFIAIAHYRVVCKIWDQEIAKLLRKDTRIYIRKILAPYPHGLGWTELPQNSEESFRYKVPLPKVHSFENVVMAVESCESLEIQQYFDWFRVMGSDVKELCFLSPLTCICQNQFLERILKEWCPNLVRLDLVRVKCWNSLVFESGFLESSSSLICKDFKDLRIFMNGNEKFSFCRKLDDPINIIRFQALEKKLKMRFFTSYHDYFIPEQIQCMNDYMRSTQDTAAFPQIVDMAGELVITPEHLPKHKNLLEIIRQLSKYFKETDGGIMGQLMKSVNLEKLVIRGIFDRNQELVTFFHFRPNKWRSSLKHLDQSFSESFECIHVLALVKFPLTTIKLERIQWSTADDKMTRFLSYFEDTLEHLECIGNRVGTQAVELPSPLKWPYLPKLKTFVHENINPVSVSAENLWSSAPNLETCCLKGCLNINRGTNIRNTSFFGRTTGLLSTTMKELKMVTPIFGPQATTFLEWFPNLVKLEMVLKNLGARALRFFGKLENSKVEQLKISFLGHIYKKGAVVKRSKTTFSWELENIKGDRPELSWMDKRKQVNFKRSAPFQNTFWGEMRKCECIQMV